MRSLSEKIVTALHSRSGVTDKWLAETLFGPGAAQQRVNSECRLLAQLGVIARRQRNDGLIGNYILDESLLSPKPVNVKVDDPSYWGSEDNIKRHIETWLITNGWSAQIAWGRTRGIDIVAQKTQLRWLFEVKGIGSLPAMRVNYFLCMLGELLQRMDDPTAKYSIALPDLAQFRNLWKRLPQLAKQRTNITAIFVTSEGHLEEVV